MTDEQFSACILDELRAVPSIELGPASRIAILSDLHMGDGSSKDDLGPNGELLSALLDRYYLERGSTLILNGDIEDTQKFPLARIRAQWKGLFAIFDRFAREGRLYKVYGNHDETLLESARYPYPLYAGIRLDREGRRAFVFHGHQASGLYHDHNRLAGAGIRYVLHTLGIRNRSPSKDSGRRYRVERRIYDFSRSSGLVSIIGHTHRPLFESLSKYDRLRFNIERLCAEYCGADAGRREAIAETVRLYKEEFARLDRRELRNKRGPGLYGHDIVLPCLFNSGCAIGKKGVTAIEIEGDRISLAYWFEEGKERSYLEREAPAKSLEGTPYRRASIASEDLGSVFARMDLLG